LQRSPFQPESIDIRLRRLARRAAEQLVEVELRKPRLVGEQVERQVLIEMFVNIYPVDKRRPANDNWTE
jgi:hypothetical protein